MKVHAEVQKAEANFESFIRTGVAWTGVVLLATGHPHFKHVHISLVHLPLSPRIEAQGAAISNFMPVTNRVVFDLGAGTEFSRIPRPGTANSCRCGRGLPDRGVAARAMELSSPARKVLADSGMPDAVPDRCMME